MMLRVAAPYFIYLKNHSLKAIRPVAPAFFEDPRLVVEGCPEKAPFIESRLKPKVARQVAEKEFRFFRDRMVEKKDAVPDEPAPQPFANRPQWYYQARLPG
jgi:hypothetical protein